MSGDQCRDRERRVHQPRVGAADTGNPIRGARHDALHCDGAHRTGRDRRSGLSDCLHRSPPQVIGVGERDSVNIYFSAHRLCISWSKLSH